MSVKISIARWMSIIGHPFALIVLLVLLVLSVRSGGAVAFWIAAIVVAAGLIPLGDFNLYSDSRLVSRDACLAYITGGDRRLRSGGRGRHYYSMALSLKTPDTGLCRITAHSAPPLCAHCNSDGVVISRNSLSVMPENALAAVENRISKRS